MNLTSAAIEAATGCFIEKLAAVELGYVDAEDPAETVIDVRDFDLPAAVRAALEAAAPHMCLDRQSQRTEWPDIPRARQKSI